MEIYNSKMELVENPDLSKGRLTQKTRTVKHAAVKPVAEKWHYETVAEYPNGGKDVRRVVDVPGVEAVPAWTETVTYWLYEEYTPEELEQHEANKPSGADERIEALEEQLAAAKILLGVE